MTARKRIIRILVSSALYALVLGVSGVGRDWSWPLWVVLGLLACLSMWEFGWGIYAGDKVGYDTGFKAGFDQAIKHVIENRKEQ